MIRTAVFCLIIFARGLSSSGQGLTTEEKKEIIEKEIQSIQPVYKHKIGVVAEVYTYGQLLNDRVAIGGYFLGATFRPITNITLGIGYDYSVLNKSILIDARQEFTKMRIRPLLLFGLGYAVGNNVETVTSSFNIKESIKTRNDIVFKLGLGTRTYFFKDVPVGVNLGFFYKNEPSFDIAESKSGAIILQSLRNKGYLCFSGGISF